MTRSPGVRGGVPLTLIGALMVAFGAYGLFEFVGYPGETTGAAEVVTVEGMRRSPRYEVSFTTADGRSVTARTALRRGPYVEAGGQLPIAYRAGDPQDVRIRHQRLSTLGGLAGAVGLFLMLNGIVAVVRGIRRR